VEQVDEHRARRLWRALEPYHAVVYFAPEAQAACTELGTRGYWMSYFALRAAPLGAAPPGQRDHRSGGAPWRATGSLQECAAREVDRGRAWHVPRRVRGPRGFRHPS